MIIGLTGYKQAGKDTAANILVKEYGFEKYAFADTLRQMAYDIDPFISADDDGEVSEYFGKTIIRYVDLIEEFGYERCKQMRDFRLFLQRLGTEAVRKNLGVNVWVDALANKLANKMNRLIVITDCRFPNEAEWVSKHGTLWRIDREQPSTDLHESEIHISTLPASQTIYNNGTVEELHSRVCRAWTEYAMQMAGTYL